MRIEDGGRAFPSSHEDGDGMRWHDGMTLRDYFAAKAMQGLCGNQVWLNNAGKNTGDPLRSCTLAAYEIADAMLKARES